MYSVYGDGVCVYSSQFVQENVKALNPKLSLSDNSAGSLEITLPVGNAGYNILEKLSSEIIVYRDGIEIWSGRIIGEKGNFLNHRILTCEGELAYLNDSTQPPSEITGTVYDLLSALLTVHNSKVGEDKQFVVGTVTVTEESTWNTNYENTLSYIGDKLVNRLGGHLRIRKVNGVRYLDYLEEYSNVNTQVIRFGENLLDFTKDWDMTRLATVILPRGAKDGSTEEYLTVYDVNSQSIYVTSEEAISIYGWIEQVVDWDDVTDANILLSKAQTYLTETQFIDMILELSAIDLHYLNVDVDAISLLDTVQCISTPHGLNTTFPVSELTIPLDTPENTAYTLGKTVRTTLTGSNKAVNDKILEKIENIPSKQSILEDAQANASSMINNATNGFITITKNQNGSQEFYIANNINLSAATKHWRWNSSGLGFWNGQYDSYGNKIYTTSITSDGMIVAALGVATGTLSATKIRTGLLESELVWGYFDGVYKQGRNVTFDLNAGKLTIRKGELRLGVSSSYPNGRFSVDDYGYLTAEYGKIGGFTISSWSIYNDVIELSSTGLELKRDNINIGKFGTNSMSGYSSQRGLVMDLEYEGNYICWAAMENSTDSYYTIKLLYANNTTNGYETDRLTFGCDVDGFNWTAYNFWLDRHSCGCDGGTTMNSGSTMKIGIVNTSGDVTGYFYARVINGLIYVLANDND